MIEGGSLVRVVSKMIDVAKSCPSLLTSTINRFSGRLMPLWSILLIRGTQGEFELLPSGRRFRVPAGRTNIRDLGHPLFQ